MHTLVSRSSAPGSSPRPAVDRWNWSWTSVGASHDCSTCGRCLTEACRRIGDAFACELVTINLVIRSTISVCTKAAAHPPTHLLPRSFRVPSPGSPVGYTGSGVISSLLTATRGEHVPHYTIRTQSNQLEPWPSDRRLGADQSRRGRLPKDLLDSHLAHAQVLGDCHPDPRRTVFERVVQSRDLARAGRPLQKARTAQFDEVIAGHVERHPGRPAPLKLPDLRASRIARPAARS